MKRYAKKRLPVRAAQWTGEMTPEITELVGAHEARVEGAVNRQLVFSGTKGPGRFAQEGDWIVSTSGEDLTVVGDDAFRSTYEEVDEKGRGLPPTDDEHDANYRDLLGELDALLTAGLKLSTEVHAGIFRARDKLVRAIRGLLEDHAHRAEQRAVKRIRDKIAKDLWP